MDKKKQHWTQGAFYTLDGSPDAPGDPVLSAVIMKPGVDADVELTVKLAGVPFIGAAFKETELDQARNAGELVLAKFWPSQEAIGAMLQVAAAAVGVEPFDEDDDIDEEVPK